MNKFWVTDDHNKKIQFWGVYTFSDLTNTKHYYWLLYNPESKADTLPAYKVQASRKVISKDFYWLI